MVNKTSDQLYRNSSHQWCCGGAAGTWQCSALQPKLMSKIDLSERWGDGGRGTMVDPGDTERVPRGAMHIQQKTPLLKLDSSLVQL